MVDAHPLRPRGAPGHRPAAEAHARGRSASPSSPSRRRRSTKPRSRPCATRAPAASSQIDGLPADKTRARGRSPPASKAELVDAVRRAASPTRRSAPAIDEVEKRDRPPQHPRRRASGPTGATSTTIRPISCEVGLLPRTHGSGLFTRGQTQVLSIVTLGSIGEEQMIDGLGTDETKRFIHHYNFPPFSVGEVRRLGSPGRREIGHGALAERAVGAGHPAGRRTSPTPSASSPRCSPRTARPRWLASAARPSR